ncbi:pentapeptide repeat-containing protein [Streptomyces sp. NPDC091259]|uniref:pentapeptide repeat-containing protein n=1 Tax=Streptomyces sp. NPDC091259 TaxID=3365976 RepID=UPI0038290179
MKTRPDTLLGRLAGAVRPTRPWLRVRASDWWTRVLLAGGARNPVSDAGLRDAKPWDASLARIPPDGTVTDGAVRASLRAGAFRGADLRGADLRGRVLRTADLRGADLRGANLSGVDLSNAYMIGADLRGADLRGTSLVGADLRGAELVGVTWSERTRWPVWLAEGVRARSVAIGAGLYRLQGGGNQGADMSGPRVPIS